MNMIACHGPAADSRVCPMKPGHRLDWRRTGRPLRLCDCHSRIARASCQRCEPSGAFPAAPRSRRSFFSEFHLPGAASGVTLQSFSGTEANSRMRAGSTILPPSQPSYGETCQPHKPTLHPHSAVSPRWCRRIPACAIQSGCDRGFITLQARNARLNCALMPRLVGIEENHHG